MKLFEDKIREDNRRASFGDNIFNYYDNNQQTKITEIRELLNKWFENYPEENKVELKQNFKNSFNDAFYELFVHETFYRQGYILEPHPLLENSTKKPDFLARKGEEEFYIEATTVSSLSELEVKQENFKAKFIDELNKMNSPIFWLGLDKLEFKKNNFPKVGKLRKAFESELNKINPAEIEIREKNTLLTNHLKYEDDNLLIILSLFIKSEAAKNKKDIRPIGFQFSPVTIKDASEDSNKILKNFKDKARRYGVLNKPFIICLNLDFNFNLKYDVDWAFNNTNSFNSISPKFTKVSAVFVSNVNVGNIFNLPKHRLIVNQHSAYPIEMKNLKLSFENQQVETNKKDIDNILKLNGQKHFGITF
ncbi:hypothetical protein [Flavobacterium limi]|uniref:Type II restriction enzyme n=1 Tax=Flavobacterium limi TaxID=2045105 RepID=A0ABQ1TY05_9FLAO|nr:hypothetical protein [Flavobacterium limi]GGF06635.1 hypothetical protein GCM10011518_14920 [Flavobacterium limi]